jgi:argininosuccinate lyase
MVRARSFILTRPDGRAIMSASSDDNSAGEAGEKRDHKPWGGRFSEPTDAFVERFTASQAFDRRLYRHDIMGSRAHARMLAEVDVLSVAERDAILEGLDAVEADIDAGQLAWSDRLEDVHMHVEQALTARIGEAGKKLHTGRSRNDQVATDLRLYLRAAIDGLADELRRLCAGLLDLAARHADVVMPGFTHLQTAQPVTFGHHMLAWFEMLLRDADRLNDCRRRTNVMPLGAAALAGTPYPIDRRITADLLGFARPAENSLDAVSDRDFAIEFCHWAATTVMHLSRMSEELVLWNTPAFAFVDLPDRFCTGSSIMPQKKNPDVAELVRAKTGRVNGHLMSLLTLMKGQPLAYNKDNQEDKEPLFDTVDTVGGCLRAFADMAPAIEINPGSMGERAKKGFATATDLADYLVNKGVAFRDAHAIVGRAVAHAIDQECDLADLPLADLQGFCAAIDADVFAILTLEGAAASRNHFGGTAPEQVRAAAERGHARLAAVLPS